MGDFDIRWDDPPPDHRPPPVDHDAEIWEALDDLFDYENDCWIGGVDEVIAQVALRFPMCSFKIITDNYAPLQPKINIQWEDKIKKPKPIKPDDMTNVVKFDKARTR